MTRKNELLVRVYLVLLMFTLAALVIMFRAFNIGVIEGERWRDAGDSLYVKYVAIPAERGNILANDGSLIATSQQFFDIFVDLNSEAMTDEIFNANIDSLSICLSNVVNSKLSPLQYKNQLITKRRSGARYHLIKRNASYQERKQIESFPLFRMGKYKGGLIVEHKSRREKPYRTLASRTIGITRENADDVGLEDHFNHILSGRDGRQLRRKVPGGYIPVYDVNEIQPVRGHDVVTTLDMDMQDAAHHALLKGLRHHDAEYGVAVVMEVATGAIMAIANLERSGNGVYVESHNKAVGVKVEPGSTVKLASVMALFESGYADMDDVVDLDGGKATFCNIVLEDSEPHNIQEATLQTAFEKSSNVGIARLISKHYKADRREAEFIDRLKQFHLDEITNVPIRGEAQPYIKEPHSSKDMWSCTTLPWMSIGYEWELTPLQILSFYNTVANNGVMMKPFLVKEIRDHRDVIERFEPIVIDDQIALASTIAKAQKLLKGVVERGTAQKLRSDYLTFAGKTGTSQTNYFKTRGRKKYQSSFAGYFPADNPKYSCIVLVRHPQKNGYYGSQVAGPIFKEIAERCYGMSSYVQNYAAADQQVKHVPSAKLPNYQVGYRQDVKTILNYANVSFSDHSDNDWSMVYGDDDQVMLKSRSMDEDKVPNVVDMGLRDALYVLENRGLKASIKGSGRVVKQSIAAGEKINGQRIALTLK